MKKIKPIIVLAALLLVSLNVSAQSSHGHQQQKQQQTKHGHHGDKAKAGHGHHGQKSKSGHGHHAPHAKTNHGLMPITTNSPEALKLYHQALALMDQSRNVAAAPLLDKALQLDPNFAMALFQRARTAGTFKEGRAFQDQLAELLKTAQLSPGETTYFAALGKARGGDMPGYLADMETLIEQFPHDHRLLMQYAGYFYARDRQKALGLYKKVAHLAPENPEVYNILGYCYMDSGDKANAEVSFKKAIHLDPKSPSAYDSYGELLLSQGRFKESIAQYDQALALEPLFPSAQIGVASNLCLLGDYPAARARLEELFPIAPHDGIRSGIHWALSVTHADEGNFDQALAELDKNFAISKKNNDTTAMRVDLFNMATIHLEAGRVHEAAHACKQAIELIRADEAMPARNKAFMEAFYLIWEGRLAVAAKDLHTARDKMTAFFAAAEPMNNANFLKNGFNLKGLIQLKSNQYTEALESFEQGTPHDPYVMYYKGLAFQGAGKKERAQEMFGYVINANSPLNYSFSFARKRAAEQMADKHGS